MRVASGAVLALLPLALIVDRIQLTPFVLLLSALAVYFFLVSWVQSDVYIEDRWLIAERFSKVVKLQPEDILDVDYVRPTQLLKLSLSRETELGRNVYFGARRNLEPFEEGSSFDDGPVFERIGRFCGWKR